MNKYCLLGIFCSLSNLLIISSAQGAIVSYTSQSNFLTDTNANPTLPLPDTGGVVNSLTVNGLEFTTPSPSFASGDFSNRLSGNVISVSGLEDLNIALTSSSPIYSFGFDFHEPQSDPNRFGTFVDSVFTVELFLNTTLVGSFSFNSPNDTAAFNGVWSDSAFNKVEIRETTGGIENEFFGQFYIGTDKMTTQTVPEPSTILGVGIGTAIAFGTGLKRKLAQAKKK
ncbi:MAG: PEP-CTERM sorting domain-containing protein [Okeania sp. SIO2D1]|nr:PEP-CTERM sorting domain-containing protein [Okeania sp. SIO2D1]